LPSLKVLLIYLFEIDNKSKIALKVNALLNFNESAIQYTAI